ncbi:MAG: sensor histidine kinase [Candidatus Pelethousia sp.]|nr:sensor histidine kinase [Candidatus Pelethousia sp.]
MCSSIRRSLRAKLIIVLGIPLLALLIFIYHQYVRMDSSRKAERAAYCQEIHNSVYKQLETEFEKIDNTSAALSHSSTLQDYMMGDASLSQQLSHLYSIKEMIRLSSRFHSDLVDVMIYADNKNPVESLLGYCPREVRIFVKYRASVMRETKDVQGHDYFFETLAAINDPHDISNRFIIRIVPVFNTSPSASGQRLVGYIALVCAVREVDKILQVSQDVYCELRGAQDGFVLLSGDYYGDHEKPANVLVTDSCSSLLHTGEFELITYCYNTVTVSDTLFAPILAVVGFAVAYLIFLFLVISRTILRPVQTINHEISEIGENYACERLSIPGEDEMGSIVLHINQMLESIGRLNANVLLTQKRLYEAQIEKSKSQLYAFQSQVAPHFLFNTLQCIRSKAFLSNEREIAQMCGDISTTLRYVLSSSETVTLKEEMDICRRYLKIVEIRFQNKITYHIDIAPDVDMDMPIPKMIIQPLVENAVYHGLEPLPGDGRLTIEVKNVQDHVEIRLVDNGVGMEAETLKRIQNQLMSRDVQLFFTSNGTDNIGLLNVYNRIRLCFGNQYGLQVERQNQQTRVIIKLPLSRVEGGAR